MRKFIYLSFVLVLGTLWSCSKSIEGETANFESYKKQIATLSAEYPTMKTALEEKLSLAVKTMDEAKGISDEKKKIEKMAEANGYIGSGFVYNLSQIKNKEKEIKNLADKIINMEMDLTSRDAANRAVKNADMAVLQSSTALKKSVSTSAEAEAAVNNAMSVLETAKNSLNAVSKTAEQKVRDTKNEKEVAEKEAEKVEKAKTITCAYCGTSTDASQEKCKSCGAALKK